MDNPVGRIVHDMRVHNRQERIKVPVAQGADLHAIREFNRLLVLNQVRRFGPTARVALAHSLGLSRATVSSIIDVLLEEGIVLEGNLLDAAPQGGRRATLVHFNADAGRVLGVDIGRSHLTLMLTNLAAEIISMQSFPFDTELGPDVCLPQIIARTRTFTEEVNLSWAILVGLGVGIPGPLDADLHRLSSPPHMPGWDKVDLWQAFHTEFQVPLLIDRDANMGALGESRCGAGRKHTNLAYIKIGTGIGGGLLLNGRIYRGHSGSAGEIGHLTLDENGPLCICGNHGCLETLASTRAIVADASHGLSLARTSAVGDTKPREKKDIAEVLQAAHNGELASIVALERAGEHIGVALSGLINIFNPSMIVVDGGIARANPVLLATLQRVAAISSLPAAWKGTSIVSGELGANAVALGAAINVIDAAFAMPPVSDQSLGSELVSTFPI